MNRHVQCHKATDRSENNLRFYEENPVWVHACSCRSGDGVVFCQLLEYFLSLRSFAHSNCANFNQAALRAVLKLENMSSSTQAKQISVRFICVYASSTLPFIAVSNRFSRCLEHCLCSFRSLFESISIDYKTLELNYFVFETFYLLSFLAPWVALKGSLINFLSGIITG